MAEKALKQIDEQLQCAICIETYSDPKQLPCSHVYCKSCLENLVERNQQEQPYITCPSCRVSAFISPTSGVAGLQTSFQVNNLFDIQDSLKQIPPTASLQSDLGSCSEHAEELKLYCETCDELICWRCAIKNGKHQSHDYDEIEDAFMKYKGEIASLIDPVEKQLSAVNDALKLLVSTRTEISEQQEAIRAVIDASIRELHEAIDARRIDLHAELQHISEGKIHSLAAQQDHLEMTQGQLRSCLDFMRDNVKQEYGGDILKMRSSLKMQIQELTGAFNSDLLKPSAVLDTSFTPTPSAAETLQNYGSVTGSISVTDFADSGTLCPSTDTGAAVLELTESRSVPDPSKCYLSGRNMELAMVGEETGGIVHVVSHNLQACYEPVKSLECQLVSEITGKAIIGSVQPRAMNQHEITYRPVVKGKHQLCVKINGEYIARNPFTIRVIPPEETSVSLGHLHSIREIKKPWGIVVTDNGRLVVSESAAHCVKVFKASGEMLHSFGTQGSREAEFNQPRGMALDREGSILVADYKNNRIQKFSVDGTFLKAVGSRGNGPLRFKGPKAITFNTYNNKVYVVDENSRIQILNSDLTYCGTFGQLGWGRGQLNDPWGVACDSMGKVYVADTVNNRIQIFTGDGAFLSTLGRKGKAVGEFTFPAGLAIDSGDRLYVSERYNHRVSVFSPEGDPLTAFGSFGNGFTEMKYPRGLTVDSCGVVYVCDNTNNRVSMF